MNALFDTNILIDYLNGAEAARNELSLYREKSISVITWMEVMVGADEATGEVTRRFLNGFRVAGIDGAAREEAVALRKQHGIRLPDAIIWATAKSQNLLLVTRNTRDFPENAPGVRVPYRIGG